MPYSGVHHVALVTPDFGRLADFYVEQFDAEVVGRPHGGPGGIRLGAVLLHVFERPAEARPGRIDHFSLRASDVATFATAREKLAAAAASDGSVTDFGTLVSLFFEDPDGQLGEVSLDKPEGFDPPFEVTPFERSRFTHYEPGN